jgi:hypothetical protein
MGDYEKFADDPAFAQAFTAAYRGRHEPHDALWWMSHPDQPCPTGVVSPAADRARLATLAYSRAGGPATQLVLASLEAELTSDRQATTAALAEASVALLEPRIPRGHEHSADEAPSDPQTPSASPGGRGRITGRWTVVGATVIALFLGIGVGVSVGATLGRASAVGASTPQSSRQPLGLWASGPPKMLDVFTRAQVGNDMPTSGVSGAELSSDTFRLLSGVPSADLAAFAIYAVRNTAGSPCLLLIVRESRQTTISCVPEPDIPRSGMSAYLQDATDYYAVLWQTDGTVSSVSGPVTALTPGE